MNLGQTQNLRHSHELRFWFKRFLEGRRAYSWSFNAAKSNSSEDYGSCDNPVSMIIECFGMMKLLLRDPIIWAFGVVSEASGRTHQKLSNEPRYRSPFIGDLTRGTF